MWYLCSRLLSSNHVHIAIIHDRYNEGIRICFLIRSICFPQDFFLREAFLSIIDLWKKFSIVMLNNAININKISHLNSLNTKMTLETMVLCWDRLNNVAALNRLVGFCIVLTTLFVDLYTVLYYRHFIFILCLLWYTKTMLKYYTCIIQYNTLSNLPLLLDE